MQEEIKDSGIGHCQSFCYDGYYKNEDTQNFICKKCDISCLTCIGKLNIDCIICNNGYYKNIDAI